jgi:hypothetical protein
VRATAADASPARAPFALADHPAARAWLRSGAGRGVPEAIEPLKEGKKSAAYRLAGVSAEGSPVVAKRCLPEAAASELLIREEVLGCSGLSYPRLYGQAMASDEAWLFLEDAGAQPYSPAAPEHRVLAARWLARLHTFAGGLDLSDRLPDRGPDHFHRRVRSLRETIGRNRVNPALSRSDQATLDRIVSCCDTLERRWTRVARFCARLPATLAHGDFAVKNLRLGRDGGGRASLLVFDWDSAGWSVASADLAQFAARSANPDLEVYWAETRSAWPHLTSAEILHAAHLGAIFRLLGPMLWEARTLEHAWAHHPMALLATYHSRLDDAMKAARLDR